MGSRKRKNIKKGRPARDPLELLIKKKSRALLAAEQSYWEKLQSLRQQLHLTDTAFDLGLDAALPRDISSTVWGLKDGVAFVRHKTVRGVNGVSFRIMPWTLQEWAEIGPIVPLEEGDLYFGRSGFKIGLSSTTLVNCHVND